jgi:hypothetical protein
MVCPKCLSKNWYPSIEGVNEAIYICADCNCQFYKGIVNGSERIEEIECEKKLEGDIKNES